MMKKVGIALGSGGTKGMAHIGVLQELEANGIQIDMIAGCSVGAIIGAMYAVQTDLDLLGKYFTNLNSRSFFDMTVPRAGKGGLLKGERMEEMVRVLTHNKSIGETNIPFFCVAVDVERGERVVFQEGPLYKCVRASLSIPGVFMPVRVQGRLCVDGGVLERVPCVPLREAGADVIIGVDVGFNGEQVSMESPTMRSVANRVLDIMQWEMARLRNDTADIMLYPKVRGVAKGLSTVNTQGCIEEGRRATKEALPNILAMLKEKGIPLAKK